MTSSSSAYPSNPKEVIFVNAHAKKALINKLDQFISDNPNVNYKVPAGTSFLQDYKGDWIPDGMENWNQKSDSAVIYFYDEATEAQKKEIAGLMTDDLIRDDNLIRTEGETSANKLKRGVFFAKLPTVEDKLALGERADKIDPQLGDAIRKTEYSFGLFEAAKLVVSKYEN